MQTDVIQLGQDLVDGLFIPSWEMKAMPLTNGDVRFKFYFAR
jgi:hypothetical protein